MGHLKEDVRGELGYQESASSKVPSAASEIKMRAWLKPDQFDEVEDQPASGGLERTQVIYILGSSSTGSHGHRSARMRAVAQRKRRRPSGSVGVGKGGRMARSVQFMDALLLVKSLEQVPALWLKSGVDFPLLGRIMLIEDRVSKLQINSS